MTGNTSPDTLELATTEELVAELTKRFDTGFLFLRRNEKPGVEHQSLLLTGDMYACLGMADHLHDEVRFRLAVHRDEIDLDEAERDSGVGEASEADDELNDD